VIERVRSARVAESIGVAHDLVPPVLLGRLGVGHFEGDAQFAGLMDVSRREWVEAGYTRGEEWPAVVVRAAFAHAQWRLRAERRPTVLHLSWRMSRPSIVLHELGHAAMLWAYLQGVPLPRVVAPFTDPAWAGRKYGEWYAEAFVSWLLPPEASPRGSRALDARYWRAWERFYTANRWGDNRAVLAHFNVLADRPPDAPPPAALGSTA
jgi:hypothetical protein